LFEPSQWADLFKRSGARYAFLTSNFHDGYCLWPSPFRPGWNSRDVGPKRDLLGDYSRAMRDAGLRAGFYCSLGEFDHPLYVKAQENGDLKPFVREHMQPQLREAVNRYSPSFSSFLSRRARPPSTLLPALREIEPIVGQTIQEFLDFYLH
jgi:alpha-L-fucosidase